MDGRYETNQNQNLELLTAFDFEERALGLVKKKRLEKPKVNKKLIIKWSVRTEIH